MEKIAFLRKTIFRNKDVFIASILLLFCAWSGYLVANFKKSKLSVVSAGFLPTLLIIFIASLSIALFLKGMKKEQGRVTSFQFNSNTKKSLAFLFLLVLFVLILSSLGFLISAFAFTMLTELLLGEGKVVRITLLSLGVSISFYTLFYKILNVILPAGILG